MVETNKSWKLDKLGAAAEEIRDSYEPTKNEDLIYIGLEHIEKGKLCINSTGISSETASTKRIFRNNDILFGSLRPYFRKVCKPKFSGCCSTDITVIRSKKGYLQDFIFYLISNQSFIDLATNYSTGTKMPRAKWKDLSKVEFLFPTYKTQRKIVSILSPFDDLIENNNRQIRILDEICQTIYNEWFVNLRFPGNTDIKLFESELGMIPAGWEVKIVKDTIKRLKSGKRYTKNNVLTNGKTPVIDQSKDELLGFHNNKPAHTPSTKNPIIIFGDHTCKMEIMIQNFSLGPNVVPFESKSDLNTYFLFFTIQNLIETKEYKRHWNDLIIKKIVLPEKKVQIAFEEQIKPLIELQRVLKQKNRFLRQSRDLILPKLISGEIDVENLDLKTEGVEA